jgi:ABC-type lipoprotein export system ATPase subunit
MSTSAVDGSTTSPLIKGCNITKHFEVNGEHVTALNRADFSVETNEFLIVHGASGSGKSTLLDTLLGLQPPSEGQLLLNDRNLYEMSAEERGALRSQFFGVVYQRSHWVKSLSVLDNVALPLHVLGYSRKEARQQAKERLEELEIERFAKYDPYLLSGGQQQRVSIARALISNPEVIVADEPTGSLDRENSDRIIALLLDACNRLGRTVILVTHNLDFLQLSQSHLRLSDGTLVQSRSSHDQ